MKATTPIRHGLAALAAASAIFSPSAVLADGPLTYHRFSETGVTNDTMPVVVNIGTLGAAATTRNWRTVRALADLVAGDS